MVDFEAMVATLSQSPDYRVLRRLKPQSAYGTARDGEEVLTGIILDTETTGLDLARDEVIELGMLQFQYTASGRVLAITGRFNQLQQPSQPLTDDVIKLTGISDADLAGHAIDGQAVQDFVAGASLVIAHNASFDRPMCERFWPVFASLRWACSLQQIPWRLEGFEGAKLGYILNHHGFFHDGHRASDDCDALAYVLASDLPTSRRTALGALLEASSAVTVRLWAVNSPIDTKDLLKARGYRWNPIAGTDNPKAWYIDLPETTLDAERAYLAEAVYGRSSVRMPTRRITALERFSARG